MQGVSLDENSARRNQSRQSDSGVADLSENQYVHAVTIEHKDNTTDFVFLEVGDQEVYGHKTQGEK